MENENKQVKIKVEDLNLVFGSRRDEALKLTEQGMSKAEVLDKTGCTVAVNNANYSIYEGEVFVVMGLSGSGKSTMLRCFNRLINPTSGHIYIDENDIMVLDEKSLREMRRNKMTMVFQNFGLLPHRTVSSNVAFGMEIMGRDENERLEKAYKTIKQVGLQGYEEMMTGELSGGMQQRVGLARALATDPEVLLMDEAFSALDPLIRTQMQEELLELQKKVQKTIVFITHDLDEALKLGDRIAIMKDGVIVQIGTPEDILMEPANDYVKAFVENVDRSTIVTAGSVMFRNPPHVDIERHGPNFTLRLMRETGKDVLPVLDKNDHFLGFVVDNDVAEAKKKNKRSVEDVVIKDVPMVADTTPVADILPFYLEYSLPVAVVDDEKNLIGLVSHSAVIAEMIGKEEEEVIQIKEGGTHE
ncbi:MAG: glycine betaine/L-proline ABC transporter ATP-binding protein [Bacteroidales bacterium]|nr:glycine betaine/L-proline ABC transporter ATP-binding protein [Bacteroidales bacterium]